MAARRLDAVMRPGDAAANVVPRRSCGACSLCCTVLRVDALKKRGGIPCAHLQDAGGGCSIYPERPRICRTYRCLWLQGGLEEVDRPDRIGAVLDLLTSGGTTRLAVREATPGASETDERLRGIIARYRESLPVRISDVRDVMDPDAPFRLLLPGGEEHRVEGELRTVWRGGECIERRRLRWLERVVRRVLHALAARRLRGYGDGA